MKRSLALPVATAAALAAVLTGCSSSSNGHSHSSASSIQAGPAASGPHNAADVSFASDMIPHHRQAVEMADMAIATSDNAQVVSLAKKIKSAQSPEISSMAGWLKGWGRSVPGDDHMGMPGMMSESDMTALGKATGSAFDTMWLNMMIEHHTGALTMSKTELAEGSNSDAMRLATSITGSQTAQIATMKQLLASK